MGERPCPHRDDEACSVCVEVAELRPRLADARAAIRWLLDHSGYTTDFRGGIWCQATKAPPDVAAAIIEAVSA